MTDRPTDNGPSTIARSTSDTVVQSTFGTDLRPQVGTNVRPEVGTTLLFFDGVCGLCNRTVDFLLARDKRARLKFAPLQSATARERLDENDIQNLNSIVVINDSAVYRKSDAVIYAIGQLGGAWRALAILMRLAPRPLRDIIYDTVANRRYTLFGKRDTCRLPTPEERTRFLD